jgi:hypothetical protein
MQYRSYINGNLSVDYYCCVGRKSIKHTTTGTGSLLKRIPFKGNFILILCTGTVITSVVDPDRDPQGSGTFAGSGTGSVTRGFRIRVHIRNWM